MNSYPGLLQKDDGIVNIVLQKQSKKSPKQIIRQNLSGSELPGISNYLTKNPNINDVMKSPNPK